MLAGCDIEAWLSERSERVTRAAREIRFEHFGGLSSLLVLSMPQSPQLRWPGLEEFYSRFSGGSIGNGFLEIGTPGEDDYTSSRGRRLLSLTEIASQSRAAGIEFAEDELPFATVVFMFVYALRRDGGLACHDRDFGTVRHDETFERVLNGWWSVTVNDRAH